MIPKWIETRPFVTKEFNLNKARIRSGTASYPLGSFLKRGVRKVTGIKNPIRIASWHMFIFLSWFDFEAREAAYGFSYFRGMGGVVSNVLHQEGQKVPPLRKIEISIESFF